MSHFSVLVAIPAPVDLTKLDSVIGEIMAPWDETTPVAPYKVYEEGGPENYWWVSAVRRGAKLHAEGAPVEVPTPNQGRFMPGKIYRAGMYLTPQEFIEAERTERAEDAVWAEKLGEHPTWGDVVRLYREKYHPGTEIARLGDVDPDDLPQGLLYDPEEEKAFEWSTYNPASKWDYWRIGGRWAGGYFKVKSNAPGLIQANSSWDSPTGRKPGLRADGGPKRLLDLDGMREEAMVAAGARYDKWIKLSGEHLTAKAWSQFRAEVEAELITIEQAREIYHAQPVVQAWKKVDGDSLFGECPLDEFGISREEYTERAYNGAVSGYAFVSLEGEWIAPGRMGWFGMSSDSEGDRIGYNAAVNLYLKDQLGDDDYLVVLDCHI
jgi:hypothetical protein